MLNMGKTMKQKSGWSRKIGAGFIMEDIADINVARDGKLLFVLCNGTKFENYVKSLNLREVDESIKFVENKIWLLSKPSGDKK